MTEESSIPRPEIKDWQIQIDALRREIVATQITYEMQKLCLERAELELHILQEFALQSKPNSEQAQSVAQDGSADGIGIYVPTEMQSSGINSPPIKKAGRNK